jgi:hypothetical protein
MTSPDKVGYFNYGPGKLSHRMERKLKFFLPFGARPEGLAVVFSPSGGKFALTTNLETINYCKGIVSVNQLSLCMLLFKRT